MVTVADELSLIAKNVSPEAPLDKALADLGARRYSGTALWDGTFAINSVVTGGTDGRPFVVLFGDDAREGAGDNASWLPFGRLAESLKKSGTLVDAVWSRDAASDLRKPDFGYWHTSDTIIGRGSGNVLVSASGGKVLYSDDANLPAALKRRLAEVRQSYVLTYTPRGGSSETGWHSVVVRLKNRSGTVIARSGYYVSGR